MKMLHIHKNHQSQETETTASLLILKFKFVQKTLSSENSKRNVKFGSNAKTRIRNINGKL